MEKAEEVLQLIDEAMARGEPIPPGVWLAVRVGEITAEDRAWGLAEAKRLGIEGA